MDISIKIDMKLDSVMSLNNLINLFLDMVFLSDTITKKKEVHWYFKGKDLEDALKRKVLENNIPTSLFYKKKGVSVIESIWAEGKSLTISSVDAALHYNLSFDLRDITNLSRENILNEMIIFLEKLKVMCICIDTNDYEYKERNVFPDRLPVGWMLYLNKKITQEQLPMAAELIHIENEKNNGTLIISTDHVFDGSDKDDIKKANEIEIQLTGLGLLPVIKDIYSA